LAVCRSFRDALAKDLYENIFFWIITKLNNNLLPEVVAKNLKEFAHIGLLDIFGFEVLEQNNFE